MKSLIQTSALAYLDHLREQGYKEHTVVQYHSDLMKSAEFLGAYRRVREIMPSEVGRFLQSDALLLGKHGQELALRTTQRTVRVLRQYLQWLELKKMRNCRELLERFEGARRED